MSESSCLPVTLSWLLLILKSPFLMYVENLEMELAKMRSFHQSKRSDNKQYAVEVR